MKKKNYRFILLILLVVICCPLFLVSCKSNGQVLNCYNINAIYNDEDQTLSCEQSIKYFNTSENILTEVCFFLYANAYNEGQKTISIAYFDRAYPNGGSYGGIQFESIEIDEIAAEYSLSDDKAILTINLAEELFPDEYVEIDMRYCVTLANINHRMGYGDHATNFGNFFPIACVYEEGFVKNKFTANGDPFYSDVSNFAVTFVCPKDYIVATSGNKVEYIENGQKKVKCEAKRVRDFCIVASKDFQMISGQTNGVEVRYYFCDDERADEHLQTSVKAVNLFYEKFGKYDYSQLSVVQTDFCFGGMEYPNLVMINQAITDDETYNYVIVHEIAHQWWYGMVGNNQYSEAWIDEGLTEFSTALFFENYSEYGLDYDTIMQNAVSTYESFIGAFEKVFGEVDQSMNRDLNQFLTEPEYVTCIYTKGMLLFDAIRNSMSDNKFFKCLRSYFEEYKYQNVSSEKLIDTFSKKSHISLRNFFDAWLDGEVVIGSK